MRQQHYHGSLVSYVTQGLAFLMITGLVLSETYGPLVLGLGILGWAAWCLGYLDRAKEAILEGGPWIWLVPGFAMVSCLWSEEPSLTFRAASETLVMTGCMVLIAKTVSPRSYILILFTILAAIALLSVPFNNLTYDFMAGRSNRTGIFNNKNTFSTASAVLVILCVVILLDRRHATWLRWLTVPLIPLALVQNLLANSVASSVALALALSWGGSIYFVSRFPPRVRKPYVTTLVVGGLVMLGLGIVIAITFNDELLAMVGKDASLTGRTDLWFYAKRIIASDSGLGVGYNAFWVTGHPMAEYLWGISHMPSGSGFSFHNLYYEVAVELGVGGVLLGAACIGMTFYQSVRWLRLDTNSESIFFFTLGVLILIIETQGYELFLTFNALYGEFMAVMLYTRNWPAWRHGVSPAGAPSGRPRQLSLVRAPNNLGPT